MPKRDITDRAEVEYALSDLAPPEGMWFTQFDPQPDYVGKTLVEVAALRGIDPVTAFMELIAESECASDLGRRGKQGGDAFGGHLRDNANRYR